MTHEREARNQSPQPHERFDLHPEDHLAAEETALDAGVEIVGIWHSHPDRPARPSETDRAQAWKGWSYVIVSANAGSLVELRSWRLVDERFVEEHVLTERPPSHAP